MAVIVIGEKEWVVLAVIAIVLFGSRIPVILRNLDGQPRGMRLQYFAWAAVGVVACGIVYMLAERFLPSH